MDDLDTREWLLTNGLGSFASGTVCDARTRTYHGWLTAAIDPPGQRRLLLSHIEASLEVAGQNFALGTNVWTDDKVDPLGYRLLHSFNIEPVPTWIWSPDESPAGKHPAHRWQLSRQIVMPHGLGEATDAPESSLTPHPSPTPSHRILIQYRYYGSEVATLRLRPLIADRHFHHLQQESDRSFSQLISPNQVLLQGLQSGKAGIPWQIRWSQGHYQPDEVWYWSYYYPEEARRGLDCQEDLFSPGYLIALMQPEETLVLEARVGFPNTALLPLEIDSFDRAAAAEQRRLAEAAIPAPVNIANTEKTDIWNRLLHARDQFITYQSAVTEPRIIAGYHWFGDRSRDTLLALPGFALTTQQFALARRLLARLGRLCCQGLIPNVVPDSGSDPVFRNIDCSLLWIETLGLYLEASQDWEFLAEQYTVVKHIYKSFTAGTLNHIRVDVSDGLLTWDDASVALTWMDTMVAGQPITPRHGKPVEINALWYSALCWASQWATWLAANPAAMNQDRLQNQARRYTEQMQQVKQSLQKFWNPKKGYLFDRIEPDDRCDSTIRPNAVIALSLHHCGFTEEQACRVLQVARDRLLTPYGLRSLDPAHPDYIGQYEGTPAQRDRAAHCGTVWSWLLGPFIRAWVRFYPEHPLPIDPQPLLKHFEHQICFNAISELFDGNPPYQPRGTIAQASPTAELLRCWGDWTSRARSEVTG